MLERQADRLDGATRQTGAYARKLRRAVKAVRAALYVEIEESFKQSDESDSVHSELWRPNEGGSVERRQGRRRPDLDKQLVPGAGPRGEVTYIASRTAFYKHLNRELTNSKRRDVRGHKAVGSHKAGG